jgi:hypothetical protein
MSILSRFAGDPKARFAKQVLAEVNRCGVEEAWVDQAEFAIGYRRSSGDEPGWVFLSNVYAESQGLDRGAVRHNIERLVQTVLNAPELPQTWAAARVCLRPVIRGATFGLGAGEHTLLSRPLLPFLSEMVVIDTPVSMAYVLDRHLAEWAVTPEEVFAAARHNLAALTGPPDQGARDDPRLIRFVDDGDGYFVSRLLVPGWLASFATPFGGRPVAFMPANNHLLIATTGSEALPGLLELAEKEFNEEPRSISPKAYTVDVTGQLIEYPAELEHTKQLHRSATILAASEYGTQKHRLEQRFEKSGVDIFVASFAVMQRPDESLFSVATWGCGVDTLLPRADYVAFADDHDRFFAEWETVESMVELPVAEGFHPPRHRVTSWPEQSIVDALKRRAVTP